MKEVFTIRSVNLSEKKGEVKTSAEKIHLDKKGIVGDAHAGPWHRQVSLLAAESITKYEKSTGTQVPDGGFGENITTEGFTLHECRPLDRFVKGDLTLELTQVGKKCHGNGCAIYKQSGDCIMPDEGVFCRVIRGGELKPGDQLEYIPKIFRTHVITLSDRASAGFYEDRSGPMIRKEMEEWFDSRQLKHQITSEVIPDDREKLSAMLSQANQETVDLVFTTGSTGLGTRDIAPEIAIQHMERQIPGIMELVRVKHGMVNPNAALSRSVAGQSGKTLIFVLPGSTRAIREYLEEITKSLWHMILMVNDIDSH